MLAEMKARTRQGAERLVQPLVQAGVSPNVLTLAGFLLNGVVGGLLAMGVGPVGGLLVWLAGATDLLDGALARAAGRSSVFGAFLDSTLDRFSEAVVLLGLLGLFLRQGEMGGAVPVTLALIGSFMVSYTRARAEGLGLRCEVGWFDRPARVAILGLGLLLGQPVLTLWVLAVAAHWTVLQRVWHVARLTRPGGG